MRNQQAGISTSHFCSRLPSGFQLTILLSLFILRPPLRALLRRLPPSTLPRGACEASYPVRISWETNIRWTDMSRNTRSRITLPRPTFSLAR